MNEGLNGTPTGERKGSGGFLHTSGANAGSANSDFLAHTLDDSFDGAKIGIPAATANVVGMADHVAVTGFFAANLTCKCHWLGAPG
jgi:hypothetical protein